MSNEAFDLKRIKQLIGLMKANDLSDVEIKHGETQITLRRGMRPTHMPDIPLTAPAHTALASLPPIASPTVLCASEEAANTILIKSPMVGTFYAASSPDTPPFAKVGDTVTPEKTVCLIEAMKVYNEIQAECSGKIVEVLAKNGATVEFGSPLFRVAVG